VRYRWGADVGVTERWEIVSEYIMIPVCALEAPDPLHSNSTFLVRFNTDDEMLYLEHKWVCGDTAGTHSCVPDFNLLFHSFPSMFCQIWTRGY